MTDAAETDRRITELEMKIAFQDEAIEQLNQTITNQWALIDRHTRLIDAMTERLLAAEQNEIGPGNEKPPHY